MADRIKITKTFGEALHFAEYGAWEDDGCPTSEDVEAAAALAEEMDVDLEDRQERNEFLSAVGWGGLTGAVVPILGRMKTRLDIRSRFEAYCVAQSIDYHAGAEGLYWWTPQFGGACERIMDELCERYGFERTYPRT